MYFDTGRLRHINWKHNKISNSLNWKKLKVCQDLKVGKDTEHWEFHVCSCLEQSLYLFIFKILFLLLTLILNFGAGTRNLCLLESKNESKDRKWHSKGGVYRRTSADSPVGKGKSPTEWAPKEGGREAPLEQTLQTEYFWKDTQVIANTCCFWGEKLKSWEMKLQYKLFCMS